MMDQDDQTLTFRLAVAERPLLAGMGCLWVKAGIPPEGAETTTQAHPPRRCAGGLPLGLSA